MSVWLDLLQQYEVTDSENKCIVLANKAILFQPQQGMFYKNEHTFLFTKYAAGFQAAFVEITKYWNQVK